MDNRPKSWVTQFGWLVMILAAWAVGWGSMLGGAMGGGITGTLMAGAGFALMAGGTLAGLAVVFELNYQAFRVAAAALLLAAVLFFASAATVWWHATVLELLGPPLVLGLLARAILRWGRR